MYLKKEGKKMLPFADLISFGSHSIRGMSAFNDHFEPGFCFVTNNTSLNKNKQPFHVDTERLVFLNTTFLN
jgi:hypothetical protein